MKHVYFTVNRRTQLLAGPYLVMATESDSIQQFTLNIIKNHTKWIRLYISFAYWPRASSEAIRWSSGSQRPLGGASMGYVVWAEHRQICGYAETHQMFHWPYTWVAFVSYEPVLDREIIWHGQQLHFQHTTKCLPSQFDLLLYKPIFTVKLHEPLPQCSNLIS